MEQIIESCQVGDVEISIETGRIAKQTNAVIVRLGETALLSAAIEQAPRSCWCALVRMALKRALMHANGAASGMPC